MKSLRAFKAILKEIYEFVKEIKRIFKEIHIIKSSKCIREYHKGNLSQPASQPGSQPAS